MYDYRVPERLGEGCDTNELDQSPRARTSRFICELCEDSATVHNARHQTAYKSSLVFCASPGMWNPTGPDPGPESRPFEIGNPVHFGYASERARARAHAHTGAHAEVRTRAHAHAARVFSIRVIARLVGGIADISRHETKGRRTLQALGP